MSEREREGEHERTAEDEAETERDAAAAAPGTERVWLVERTYSDNEQNLIILVYATTDGTRYYRKERALTSFTDRRDTTAAVDVAREKLGTVSDEETQLQYAEAAKGMQEKHDPDDVI